MHISFEDFKTNYMGDFGGYVPTYITASQEYSDKGTIQLNVEMIAPFRMTDGPSRFFRVIQIVVNKEQYEEVKMYAAKAGDAWKEMLVKNAEECLQYSNKFEEIEK